MLKKPSDSDWLTAAARLGLRGRPASAPNPAVGAIIVKHGRVIGRGWTQHGGRPHAEAVALEQAGSEASGATIYTSLEPCAHSSQRGPSCSSSIAAAGIGRVIYALEDPDPRTCGKGADELRAAGVEVIQMDSAVAREGLAGYLTKATFGRPHVTLKLAPSLDGFIALPSGESQWITGDIARAHVHSRRAMADAILVGGGTWRSDSPSLNVRLEGLEHLSPQRIVLTKSGTIPGVQTIDSPEAIGTLDGVQYLYVEGGAQTAASFLKADLVDRLDIYRAPILLGSGKSAAADLGLSNLSDAHGRWQLAERRQLGSDSYEAFERRLKIAHTIPLP